MVRVRINNYIRKIIEKNSTTLVKMSPCKIVCSSKSVIVQFYPLVQKCLHAKVSSCNFCPRAISSPFIILYARANLTSTRF